VAIRTGEAGREAPGRDLARSDGEPAAMRIAIMGTRGAPASYGGFETFAEELGARLTDRATT